MKFNVRIKTERLIETESEGEHAAEAKAKALSEIKLGDGESVSSVSIRPMAGEKPTITLSEDKRDEVADAAAAPAVAHPPVAEDKAQSTATE